MRFNPVLGMGFAIVVLLIWVWQGLRGPTTPPGQAPAVAENAPLTNGLAPGNGRPEVPQGLSVALLLDGDRLGEGAAAGLHDGLLALERQDGAAVTVLDRVSPGRVATVLGRWGDQGWPLVVVAGPALEDPAGIVAAVRKDMAITAAHPDARDTARADSALGAIGFRDWEMGALTGAAAALASPSGQVGFLDLAGGTDAGESFRKAAESARPDLKGIRVAHPPVGTAGTVAEGRALLSGLAAWGADVVVVRASPSVLDAMVALSGGGEAGPALILWAPWRTPESGGADLPALEGPVIGLVAQRTRPLLLKAAESLAGQVSVGLAEGAQDLLLRHDVLSDEAMQRVDVYRQGVSSEGTKAPPAGE